MEVDVGVPPVKEFKSDYCKTTHDRVRFNGVRVVVAYIKVSQSCGLNPSTMPLYNG